MRRAYYELLISRDASLEKAKRLIFYALFMRAEGAAAK